MGKRKKEIAKLKALVDELKPLWNLALTGDWELDESSGKIFDSIDRNWIGMFDVVDDARFCCAMNNRFADLVEIVNKLSEP